MATVSEVLKLALPGGTVLVGGAAGLRREVVWARLIAADGSALEQVQPGELALVALSSQNARHAGLAEILTQLARLEAAAVVVGGDVPPGARALADFVGIPLLSLPPDTRLAEIERTAIALLVNRRAEVEQRGVQIYRKLAEQALGGGSLGAIAETLSEITAKTTLIQDTSGTVLGAAGADPLSLAPGELEQWLRDDDYRAWLGDQPLVSTSPPVLRRPAGPPGWHRYAAPIVVRGGVAGIVSIVGRDDELDELDRVAAGRAAAVCAIAMAQRMAISEAESRLRGDFLDDLLHGRLASSDAIHSRAAPLGYDFTRPHAVVVFEMDTSDAYLEWLSSRERMAGQQLRQAFASGILEGLAHECPGMPVLVRAESAVVLVPLETQAISIEQALEQVKSHAEAVRRAASARLSQVTVSAGVGRIYDDAISLSRAYREAEQALTIALRLFGGNRTTAFDDLGIYRLLFHLQGTPELRSFYQENLARLVEHDREHGSDFLATLRAFFAAHGNLSRTAELLYLHRNTVAYRIARIEQLTGLCLENEDDRFRIQLALRLKEIV